MANIPEELRCVGGAFEYPPEDTVRLTSLKIDDKDKGQQLNPGEMVTKGTTILGKGDQGLLAQISDKISEREGMGPMERFLLVHHHRPEDLHTRFIQK